MTERIPEPTLFKSSEEKGYMNQLVRVLRNNFASLTNSINSIESSSGGVESAEDLTNGVTGSGQVVLDNTPTLITPNIGVASGTSLNLTGNLIASNVSGSNTGDQTITLTGDVTGSGSAAFGTTIANKAVTYGKIQDITTTDRILGRESAGAGTIEEIICTAAGRALIDDANATAQRATLGLTIGTNVQAYNINLDDISGLTPTDGNIIIGDGLNFITESDSTARASLGLTIGTDVQAHSTILDNTTASYTIAEETKLAGIETGAQVNTVDSVNTQTGAVVLDPDDLDDTSTINKFTTASDISKLAGIEALADVTDTANVTSAGALMDSELTSLTGVKTLTLPDNTTISTFGATLVDDVDASTARTTLGVAIGTDVQAYDTGLTDIAGLSVTDGNIIVGDGVNWVAESGATARASLGLTIGTDVQAYDVDTAKTDVAQEYTATQNFNATTLTDATTISWDASVNQVTSVTLTDNRTLGAPTNLVDGGTYILIVKQDATGSRTLAYNAVFKFPGGTAPTLSTDANAVDILTFVSDGTNMYGAAQLGFA